MSAFADFLAGWWGGAGELGGLAPGLWLRQIDSFGGFKVNRRASSPVRMPSPGILEQQHQLNRLNP